MILHPTRYQEMRHLGALFVEVGGRATEALGFDPTAAAVILKTFVEFHPILALDLAGPA